MTRKMAWLATTLLLGCLPSCAAKQERGEPSAPAESAPAGSFAEPPPPAAPSPEPATAAEGEKDALEESRSMTDDLASAQAELDAAKRELDLALEPVAARKPSATGGAAPPAATPSRARPTDGAAADEAPKSKAEKKGGETSCQTACRAFQSLGRAAGSICRLTGDEDDRCTHARGVVSQAERRVTACACRSE